MIRYILFIFLLGSINSYAGSIDSTGTYNGKVTSVAVGFWGHVGIQLDGVTCNGRNEAILLKENEFFNSHLSVLLAAQVSKETVVLYRLDNNKEIFSEGYEYCIVTSASIGNFGTW